MIFDFYRFLFSCVLLWVQIYIYNIHIFYSFHWFILSLSNLLFYRKELNYHFKCSNWLGFFCLSEYFLLYKCCFHFAGNFFFVEKNIKGKFCSLLIPMYMRKRKTYVSLFRILWVFIGYGGVYIDFLYKL